MQSNRLARSTSSIASAPAGALARQRALGWLHPGLELRKSQPHIVEVHRLALANAAIGEMCGHAEPMTGRKRRIGIEFHSGYVIRDLAVAANGDVDA